MGYLTPGDFTISASYDQHKQRNPPSKEPGTDFNLPYGTDIRMAESGVIVVVDNNNNGAEGRRLELHMDNGEVLDYIHCSRITGVVNQRVTKGQFGIAFSGASGNGQDWYYGPHVHVTRRARQGLPYADSIDFMLAVDKPKPKTTNIALLEENMPNGYYVKGDKKADVAWLDQETGIKRPVPWGELNAAQKFNAATGGVFGTGYVCVIAQADFDTLPVK